MERDYLKEKANCLRNEMNHLWGAVFVTGGGSVGFSLISGKTLLSSMYLYLGILFSLIFLNAYIVRRTQLIQLVRDIGGLDNKKGEKVQNGKIL